MKNTKAIMLMALAVLSCTFLSACDDQNCTSNLGKNTSDKDLQPRVLPDGTIAFKVYLFANFNQVSKLVRDKIFETQLRYEQLDQVDKQVVYYLSEAKESLRLSQEGAALKTEGDPAQILCQSAESLNTAILRLNELEAKRAAR